MLEGVRKLPVMREIASQLDHPMKRIALRARLMHPYWRRRFYEFGEHSILHRPEWLVGTQKIAIGKGTVILRPLTIAVEHPALGGAARPVIRIGTRVYIRPYCTIAACESIVIEDDVGIGSFVSVLDADRTYERGLPHATDSPPATSPVHIGRGSVIYDRSAVLRGSRIGRSCWIGANSVVKGDIPDYSIAVGSPARVIGSTREYFERAHEQPDPARA